MSKLDELPEHVIIFGASITFLRGEETPNHHYSWSPIF